MKPRILKSMQMLDEDTVEMVFEDNILIDLEGMQEAYREYAIFTRGKKLKRLVVVGKHTDITKDARKFGEKENERLKDFCLAEAMVVYTFVQKMVVNFYLKYIKDLYPTRSFTSYDEAKEWILNYKIKA